MLEVVLAFSVILLNIATFLPMIRETREAARRNQCTQNLKLLGLAIANYQDVHRSYPSGFDVCHNGKYPGWGWNLKLLPYMNAADVYQEIDIVLFRNLSVIDDSSRK